MARPRNTLHPHSSPNCPTQRVTPLSGRKPESPSASLTLGRDPQSDSSAPPQGLGGPWASLGPPAPREFPGAAQPSTTRGRGCAWGGGLKPAETKVSGSTEGASVPAPFRFCRGFPPLLGRHQSLDSGAHQMQGGFHITTAAQTPLPNKVATQGDGGWVPSNPLRPPTLFWWKPDKLRHTPPPHVLLPTANLRCPGNEI